MLCNVCRDGLEGIWDPARTKRVCTVDEWKEPQDDLPPATRKYESKSIASEDTERPDAPERFIFGHHVTRESFLEYIDRGCVFCNRFAMLEKDAEPNPQIQRLGFYSLFQVTREPAIMYMRVGNRQGGFEMEPFNCIYIPLRIQSSSQLIIPQLATCS